MQHSSLHAVILAGGSGTRFWPLSREQAPKQMLSLFGTDSLLIDALNRAEEVIGSKGTIHIVVGKSLIDELRNHILSHEKWGSLPINYIVEPAARNTAPALALAAAVVDSCDEEATLIMLPADHLTEDGPRWIQTIVTAVEAASDGSLVTIGLHPTAPETGFGYIQADNARDRQPVSQEIPLSRNGQAGQHNQLEPAVVLPVKRFVEKPDLETAIGYLAEGDYYWNSGMLVARADAILAELEAAQKGCPDARSAKGNADIVAVSRELAANPESKDAAKRFAQLPKEPFDKAALELSKKVKVVPTAISWSDVGSLLSLEALQEPNKQGTRIIGQGVDVGSANTINYSSKRLVATLGLSDVVVVDTEDATLVAAKDRVQDVRLIVDELQRRGAPETKQSQTSLRPWGSWTMLTRGIGYQVKEIEVLPGASLSLQRHKQRSEHWIVIEGTAQVEVDGVTQTVYPGQSTFIPTGAIHRLANEGDTILRVTEVAVGDYLGEDDIERFEDRYSR
ncbi:MAG: mannose-1-phosphate guanylyltransferase/mannose-6-phosphate isomerase [Coriobacteriia bacterium]|nr:mannose-1-phosphate guanylyltransferase/mannose-6-phosphate isomerase [Coriobacteriia bacterium]MCL2870614.1 mannose-1-phosphate guanylyltransferase/mannose-6-phosphate isomerase [Coriobacteriia bacterium]